MKHAPEKKKKNNCHRQMKPTPVIPVSSRREGLALNLQLCRTSSEVCSVQFPYHGNICNIRKQLWDFSSNRDWQRCWRFCMAALSWHQLSVSAGSWKHQFAKAPANAAEWNSHPETCQELSPTLRSMVHWCLWVLCSQLNQNHSTSGTWCSCQPWGFCPLNWVPSI